jgi:hypothetical protein
MGEVGAPRNAVAGQISRKPLDDLARLTPEQAQKLGLEIAVAERLVGEMDKIDRATAIGDGLERPRPPGGGDWSKQRGSARQGLLRLRSMKSRQLG